MSTTRFEEVEKNFAAMQAQLEAHAAGEMDATDSPTKFQRWNEEHRRLTLELERLTRLVEAAKRTDENDQLQELLAKADAQRVTNLKIAEWLKTEGNELLKRAEAIIQKVAELDVETTELNKRLPSDVPQIASVDAAARSRPALPRKDISEKRVDLWVDLETGNLVSDQTSVADHGDGIGTIAGGPVAFGRITRCAKRRFRQVEFHPREQAQWVDPLFKVLRLPFFDRPGLAWSGDNVQNAQATLNLLKRDKSEPARPVLIEIVPEGEWMAPNVPRRSAKQKRAAGAAEG